MASTDNRDDLIARLNAETAKFAGMNCKNIMLQVICSACQRIRPDKIASLFIKMRQYGLKTG